ncbi:MAG: DUF1569 domain-containing protein [Ferruginibacter sp.]
MKTVFDKTTRDELINRINALNENSKAQWGKMNIYQGLKHCTLFDEMVLGRTKYKRAFIGRLFGKMALNGLIKDETPFKRNQPTSSGFKIAEKDGNVSAEKKKWIALVEEYAHFSNNDFVHWFFGKMTKEQIGYFVYKHTDHHLRQFNS